MIDPEQITNFERDEAELQELLLFALFAVHTNADVAVQALNNLLTRCGQKQHEPFIRLNELVQLLDRKNDNDRTQTKADLQGILSECGLRYHGMRAESILQITDRIISDKLGWSVPMLWKLDRDDLVQWHGVGMKTSSFFLLHSVYDANVACLDVHIMRYLKQSHPKAPSDPWKAVPEYLKWERVFLDHAAELEYHPAELDLLIWSQYRKNPDFNQKDIPCRKDNHQQKLFRKGTSQEPGARIRKQEQMINLDNL